MSNLTGVVEFKLGTQPLTVGETIEKEPYAFEQTGVKGFSNKLNRVKKPAIQKIKVEAHMDENYDQAFIESFVGTITMVQDNGKSTIMSNASFEGTPTENDATGMAEIEFTGVILENTPANA